MKLEQEILQNLFSSWVSLGLEYAEGAPGIQAVYIYGSSERGSTFVHVYYEQSGKVLFPGEVSGIATDNSRVFRLLDLFFNDLENAEKEFAKSSIVPPTEYRVYYNTATRALDVQLSRDLIYAHDPVKVPEQGIEDWLGDRALKIFG